MEPIVELPGESVLFVRVKPGMTDRALKDLRKHPSVSRAEPVLGPYDIVVTGAFKNVELLQKFAEELGTKEFYEGCAPNPSFEEWNRPEKAEREISAWTLIKAVNPQRAMKELQRIAAVNSVYTTAGEFNVIANIAANKPQDLMDTLLKEVQKIKDVRRTETLAGIPEEEG